MKMTKRRWAVTAGGTLLLAAAAWSLVPDPVEVDAVAVSRGPLEVSISEEGMTRIRERYEIAAPVTGRLLRVEVHAGDLVAPGTLLARIEAAQLDPKQQAQSAARLQSALLVAGEAEALLRRAVDAERRAKAEATRLRKLAEASVISRDQLESALTTESMTARESEAARLRAKAAESDVMVARAALGQHGEKEIVVRSPVPGRVLKVMHESETVISAGAPIVVVGDSGSLEIVADFLSNDAVRIKPGAPARIERWGGPRPLTARVRIVEPAGFTKVSALGVEEQRVNVICDLLEPAPALGDQYRVDVRVLLWNGSVTKIPATAAFMKDGQWQLFAIEKGRAQLRQVQLGELAETEVELRSGLREGDKVIVHPSDQIRENVKVVARR